MIRRFSAREEDAQTLPEIITTCRKYIIPDLLSWVFGKNHTWKITGVQKEPGNAFSFAAEDQFGNIFILTLDTGELRWELIPVNRTNIDAWKKMKPNHLTLNEITSESLRDVFFETDSDLLFYFNEDEFERVLKESLTDVLDSGIQLPYELPSGEKNKAIRLFNDLTDRNGEDGYYHVNAKESYIEVLFIIPDNTKYVKPTDPNDSVEIIYKTTGSEARKFWSNAPLNIDYNVWVLYKLYLTGLV